MFAIPATVVGEYVAVLQKNDVPLNQFDHYKKWLRYFNDFCTKYPDAASVTHQVKSDTPGTAGGLKTVNRSKTGW